MSFYVSLSGESGVQMPVTVKILEVLIPITIGLLLRLAGLFGDREGKVLQKFCVRFAVPVLVFFSMYDVEPQALPEIPAMMAALVLLSVTLFAAGWLCSRFVNSSARKAAVHACVLFGNYGWMGFGVAQTLLGGAGLVRAVFFTLLWWPVFYGFGLPLGVIHGGGRKGGVPVGKVLRVVAPLLGCLCLGLVFNLSGWKLPPVLDASLRPFGDMAVPLILFSVGVMLDLGRMRSNLAPALLISALTLVVAPFIGWGVAALLARSAVSYKVIIMEAAMPVASMTPLLAENIEIDLDLVNATIAVSTVLSLVTVPIVAALVV